MTTLITSALPYVNNVPHLGNIVGSTLSADVYARYMRKIKGKNNVLYLCGTDEYGTTTEVKAKKEGMTCKEICDKYHKIHKEVYDWFEISFDIFGRTTTETQTELTHEIFLDLYRNGFIEQRENQQLYCDVCCMFLADRYLKGICYLCGKEANGDQCDKCNNLIDPLQFKNAWCITCKTSPIIKSTKHLYIKLKEFEDQLKSHFIDGRKVYLTDNAYNITKAFLSQGLESRCITRDLKWGTPIPATDDVINEFPELEEYKDKVFYVWFDAPIGYLSILKHGMKEKGNDNWEDWLRGDNIQFMAKDNVSFHTVIYPSTLLGSGRYPLLTGLSATEYLDFEGKKFSKTDNVGIFGDQVIEISNRLNINADYWRFYLMMIRPETHDSSFNWKEFATLIKGELVDKIGNFINRCVSLSTKLNIEEFDFGFEFHDNNDETIEKYKQQYHQSFNKFKFRDALFATLHIASYGNTYLQMTQPWVIMKTDIEKAKSDIQYAIYICITLLDLLEPFIPITTNKIMKVFKRNGNHIIIDKSDYSLPFKTIELEKTDKIRQNV